MMRVILLTAVTALVAACAAPATGVEATPSYVSNTDSNIAAWTVYREFNFGLAAVDVSMSDAPKLRDIVAYLESNPSLDIAIEGTEGISPADRDLSEARAASVRRALMDTGAGVASYKIVMEPFAQSKRGRPGQIRVLVGPRTGSPKATVAAR